MRFIPFFCGMCIFASLCHCVAPQKLEDIEKDIYDNKQKLEENAKEKRKISSRLSTLGNTINARKRQIVNLREQIVLLQKSINQNQSQNQSQTKKLEALRVNLQSLEREKSTIQAYVANIIIKDLSFLLVLDKHDMPSPDDVILEEVFDLLAKQSQSKILSLSERQRKITDQIGLIANNIDEITTLIGAQQSKKEQLQKMINEQNLLNDKLQTELNAYNQKLVQITKERDGLDSILQNLNIIKADKQKELERQRQAALLAAQKAQKEKEEQEAKSRKGSTNSPSPTLDAKEDHLNIVQVANSYKNVSVVKYTGAKTIAPLEYYTIEQNFGPYFDPVYNLKVFNESITLLSKVPNAVVYNILDGKVVYAKEAPVLKKVVIVEHSNETYTIYSQLDKIAPTIKPGFMVKKGYTIGRISQRLGLEITQKDKHIDPIEVIAKSK